MNEPHQKSTYIFSVDALRVVAIIGVIIIHFTTKTLQVGLHDVNALPYTLFLNQASRFAVPLFFLISGFVLELNNKKNLSYKEFFKKRASRILLPFLFWSILYFLNGRSFDLTQLLTPRFVIDLIFGTASYHLYFIPTLIFFYLGFPFLHKIIHFLKNPLVLIFIIVLQGALQFKDYYLGQIQVQYSLRIALLSISMFVLGMTASHYRDWILNIVKRYLWGFIILIFITISVIYFHVRSLTLVNSTPGYIYNQYGPLNYAYTILLTSALFFLLEKTQYLRKVFMALSKLSFFVFFIHVLILNYTWKLAFEPLMKTYGDSLIQNVLFDIVGITIITAISFAIAYLIHKIPYASKITG